MGKKNKEPFKFHYPIIKREDHVDKYYGISVEDPYNWMETINLETNIDRQTMLFKNHMEEHCSQYFKLNKLMEQQHQFQSSSCPITIADGLCLYFSSNGHLQQDIWIHGPSTMKTDARILLSPRQFSTTRKEEAFFQETSISQDGNMLGFTVNNRGQYYDWCTAYFFSPLTLQVKNTIVDMLEKIKFTTLAITADNTGVFYACYPYIHRQDIDNYLYIPENNQLLFYHMIGTDQEDDIVISEFPNNPNMLIPSYVTYGGQYLLITPTTDCKNNAVYYTDIKKWEEDGKKPLPKFLPIIPNPDAEYHYVHCSDSLLFFRTNKNAPNFRLIVLDINQPEETSWVDLIAEHPDMELVDCVAAYGGYMLVHFRWHLSSTLQIWSTITCEPVEQCALPGYGAITEMRANPKFPECYYSFQDFLTPEANFRIDLEHEYTEKELKEINRCSGCGCKPKQEGKFPNTLDLTHKQRLPSKKYTISCVEVPNRDKIKSIIMYICHKKKMKLDAGNPCMLLTALGSSESPFFRMTNTVFLENMNGVVALVDIPKDLRDPQVSLDDFQTAAEWLISNRYTCAEMLCIYGNADGAFLVAAAANQRPDLYRVVVADEGVMDLLHHEQLDPSWPGGEYLDTSTKQSFRHVYKFSPLHNIKVPESPLVQYPAFLLRIAEHRTAFLAHCVHSCKFVAELQHVLGKLPQQTNPLMLNRIKVTGRKQEDDAEDDADLLAFILLFTKAKLTF